MAEKVKQTGIIIAIIAGITLPTLAIAWAGGGRLARVEVVAEEAKEGVDLHTIEIKALTEDIHSAEIIQTQINTKLNSVPKIEDKLEKLTDYIMQNWEFKDKGDK